MRIRPYQHFTVGGTRSDFIHVFAYIMEGRDIAKKSALSKSIVGKLKSLFPDVPVISMNVMEFEWAAYTNKGMV